MQLPATHHADCPAQQGQQHGNGLVAMPAAVSVLTQACAERCASPLQSRVGEEERQQAKTFCTPNMFNDWHT